MPPNNSSDYVRLCSKLIGTTIFFAIPFGIIALGSVTRRRGVLIVLETILLTVGVVFVVRKWQTLLESNPGARAIAAMVFTSLPIPLSYIDRFAPHVKPRSLWEAGIATGIITTLCLGASAIAILAP